VLTLALDASTYRGTVAVLRAGVVIGESAAALRGETEERLMPAVAAVLREHDVSVTDLEAVACGGGPGSFTSLRIAASIAKGIAAARSLPLYVTPSPLLIIAGAVPALPPGRYLAMLDAMRGDVFTLMATVGATGGIAVEDSPTLESRASAQARAQSLGATCTGPREVEQRDPHARGFATLLDRDDLVWRADVTSWEPEYGRKAEAQVRWEQAHGRALDVR
jgi:tRNA threonylcarbamoyladenosine biosynthesis protein TsaB